MNEVAAHQSAWRTAAVVFAVSLVLGGVLQFFFPLSLLGVIDSALLHIIGAPLLILGTFIVYQGKLALAQQQQPSEPGRPTTALVRHGVFRYSRNPLYAGICVAYAGLAVATDMPWWLLLNLPTAAALHYFLILPEERYLERRFGQEYRDYRRQVRRWF